MKRTPGTLREKGYRWQRSKKRRIEKWQQFARTANIIRKEKVMRLLHGLLQ